MTCCTCHQATSTSVEPQSQVGGMAGANVERKSPKEIEVFPNGDCNIFQFFSNSFILLVLGYRLRLLRSSRTLMQVLDHCLSAWLARKSYQKLHAIPCSWNEPWTTICGDKHPIHIYIYPTWVAGACIQLTHLIQKHLDSELDKGGKANTAVPRHACAMPVPCQQAIITGPETPSFIIGQWFSHYILQISPFLGDFSCFPVTSQAPGIAIAGACLRGVIWAKSDLTTVPPCRPQGHPLALPTEHAAALRFWHRCHSHLTLRLGQEHCRWQLGSHSEHRATSINQPKIEHVQSPKENIHERGAQWLHRGYNPHISTQKKGQAHGTFLVTLLPLPGNSGNVSRLTSHHSSREMLWKQPLHLTRLKLDTCQSDPISQSMVDTSTISTHHWWM